MNNKEIIKYYYETVMSENLLEEVQEFVSPQCVERRGEKEVIIGAEGMKENIVGTREIYPNFTINIIRTFEDGDYIISEFIMTGTHEGEWIGITPTHKMIKIRGVYIDKIVNGKIVEHGEEVNIFEPLFGVGAIKTT